MVTQRAAALLLILFLLGLAPAPAAGAQTAGPRPVVMVHGFGSSWEAWANYLGPEGFLAQHGIQGFAVGDGQVPGVMNTGGLGSPEGRTNTIAENAAVLGAYIAAVKDLTGAEQVDLLAHSMGGLISRYYIGRVMETRDVNQLIMLGSPMAGTACANLPASLGLYLPASLEIRPAYVSEIFNVQVTERHGVPFHALAGDPIIDSFKSPCTEVPTDLAVALDSVNAISLELTVMPVLHTDLNLSQQVFDEYVLPLLQAEEVPPQQAPLPPALPEGAGEQYSQVFTGRVAPGEPQEVTVNIDGNVVVAAFALYDPSHSLQVTVRGASGNIIPLDPATNGLVVVDDPAMLFYLGYGFQNPRPGPWVVTLEAGEDTPAAGTEYSLMARLAGGAVVAARAEPLLPQAGHAVQIAADLSLGEAPLAVEAAQAQVQLPDGRTEELALEVSGSQVSGVWNASIPGVHGINLAVQATAPDGSRVERAAFLAVDVQPEPRRVLPLLLAALAGVCLVGLAVLGLGVLVVKRLRRG
jgi:pimeloyl-ACP methyl ester carboxylesterase